LQFIQEQTVICSFFIVRRRAHMNAAGKTLAVLPAAALFTGD